MRHLRATRSRFLEPSRDGIWPVEDFKGGPFVVEESGECDCEDPEECDTPCSHVLCMIKAESENPVEFFLAHYHINTYRKVYDEALHPLSKASLTPSLDTTTPAFQPQAGRPRVKQFRKEQWGAKKIRCEKCRQRGNHMKRTCTRRVRQKMQLYKLRRRDWQPRRRSNLLCGPCEPGGLLYHNEQLRELATKLHDRCICF